MGVLVGMEHRAHPSQLGRHIQGLGANGSKCEKLFREDNLKAGID